MKVSDLINILEQHKDKELYHLNMGNTIQVDNIKKHIVDDVLFLEIKGMSDFRYISDMESLDEGFVPRLRTDVELDIFKIQKKREERSFNYFFPVGSEVVIDEEVIFDFHKTQFSHLLGKKGIVKKSESNFHAYGQEKSYAHVVEWENGHITQDTDWVDGKTEYDDSGIPKNFLSTIFLKKYENM